MKLLEFEGEVAAVGDGYVRVKRDVDSGRGWLMEVPSHPEEEVAAGRHLYARVRVTVELLDHDAAVEKETTP
jgi:hypothetical protein